MAPLHLTFAPNVRAGAFSARSLVIILRNHLDGRHTGFVTLMNGAILCSTQPTRSAALDGPSIWQRSIFLFLIGRRFSLALYSIVSVFGKTYASNLCYMPLLTYQPLRC